MNRVVHPAQRTHRPQLWGLFETVPSIDPCPDCTTRMRCNVDGCGAKRIPVGEAIESSFAEFCRVELAAELR